MEKGKCNVQKCLVLLQPSSAFQHWVNGLPFLSLSLMQRTRSPLQRPYHCFSATLRDSIIEIGIEFIGEIEGETKTINC